MPATRSRTVHWLDCLRKIHERNGAIDIAVARDAEQLECSDVVWRVRIIDILDDAIIVEQPSAFGETIPLSKGVRLVGGMSVGQNRWMFHTQCLGHEPARPGSLPYLRLSMPERTERCSRRSFFRISTADLNLVKVRCWPLEDPTSAIAAETANRLRVLDAIKSQSSVDAPAEEPADLAIPTVGPRFDATMLNLSGGGLGLMVDIDDSAAVGSRPHLWLQIDLRPDIPAPLSVTGRVAHSHIDSAQNLYVGLAFDFTHNPEHRSFIANTLTEYIHMLQHRQAGRCA